MRVVWALVVLGVGFAVFLGIYGGRDTVKYDEDVAIVLGNGIVCGQDDQGEPNDVLGARLDKAVEYHERNPEAKIIVAGGNERNLCESEAAVMKKYLIRHNVREEIILLEDRSSSTAENLRFSREIMREQGLERAVIITSRSHMFRAAQNAERLGMAAKRLAAPEPWYRIPLVYGYEVVRTTWFWFEGRAE